MRSVGGCFVLLLTVVALGCGGKSGPRAVDVAGTISLDGKPLEGVEVHFASEKFEGYGKTDEFGKYRLVNGAVAGTNKIFLKKFDIDGVAGIDRSIPGMDDGQAAAMLAAQGGIKGGKGPGSVIPAEYSDPNSTKLTFIVPDSGTESADFRITSSK
ncbi:MAG: hypothetical protein JWM11_4559 [Planctomycetaceae bacterium]|nr:hypothetical protein [Planctomycetaceae bacterium]